MALHYQNNCQMFIAISSTPVAINVILVSPDTRNVCKIGIVASFFETTEKLKCSVDLDNRVLERDKKGGSVKNTR